MFNNVMIPLDGSRFAEQALPYAVLLARASGAVLHIVMVHEPRVLGEALTLQRWDVLEAEQREQDQDYLAALSRRLCAELGTRPETSLLTGSPAATLSRVAQRRGMDLIVMSTHACGGVNRMWLGSVADELIRRAHVPLLLVRPDEKDAAPAAASIEKVLVAVDGSTHAERALEQAARLGGALGASCTVLRVVVPPTHRIASSMADTAYMTHVKTEERTEAAIAYVRELVARTAGLPTDTTTEVFAAGHPASAILHYAESMAADVIAIGTRGHRRAARLLLGSVADKIIRSSPVPVLVCPASRKQ